MNNKANIPIDISAIVANSGTGGGGGGGMVSVGVGVVSVGIGVVSVGIGVVSVGVGVVSVGVGVVSVGVGVVSVGVGVGQLFVVFPGGAPMEHKASDGFELCVGTAENNSPYAVNGGGPISG